jgi:hypothetical protein
MIYTNILENLFNRWVQKCIRLQYELSDIWDPTVDEYSHNLVLCIFNVILDVSRKRVCHIFETELPKYEFLDEFTNYSFSSDILKYTYKMITPNYPYDLYTECETEIYNKYISRCTVTTAFNRTHFFTALLRDVIPFFQALIKSQIKHKRVYTSIYNVLKKKQVNYICLNINAIKI